MINSLQRFFHIIFFSVLLYGLLSGQSITNPSLEGYPQMHVPPPDWEPCKYNSTPDTQPGVFYNYIEATDGETYLGMVTRGDGGDNANSTESCGTSLSEPLHTESCYVLKMDLHMSVLNGHFADWIFGNWQAYDKPVMLKIHGGKEACTPDELLAEIGPITNTNWETCEIPFSAETAGLQYLILEVDWVGGIPYFGNVMIDNLQLERFDLNLDLGSDATLCYSDVKTLDARSEGATSYVWQDGSTNPVYEATESGIYWVNVSNEICYKTDTINLKFNDCQQCNMFVQGLYAPNSDHPILYPRADCEVLDYQFQVYNILGQLIFETNDYFEGWDGRTGSPNLKSGIYIYRITYYAEDWGELKTQVKKGKIMVYGD